MEETHGRAKNSICNSEPPKTSFCPRTSLLQLSRETGARAPPHALGLPRRDGRGGDGDPTGVTEHRGSPCAFPPGMREFDVGADAQPTLTSERRLIKSLQEPRVTPRNLRIDFIHVNILPNHKSERNSNPTKSYGIKINGIFFYIIM